MPEDSSLLYAGRGPRQSLSSASLPAMFRFSPSPRETTYWRLGPPVIVSTRYMSTRPITRDLKRSSASLLVLALLEDGPLHGYEIGKRIEARSGGEIAFNAASLYPLLYRLERKGWISGQWQQKSGERRRRFYRITAEGRRTVAGERGLWQSFVSALDRVVNLKKA